MSPERKYKFSNNYATELYLKIEKNEYIKFLEKIPFSQDIEDTLTLPENGEYKQKPINYEFKYKNNIYEIHLRPGMSNLINNNEYKFIPLPTYTDQILKKIILRSLIGPRPIVATEFIILNDQEDRKFIQIVITNAAIDGYTFNEEEVFGAMVKIESCQLYIRRKGLILFFPIPWAVMFQHKGLSENFYSRLGSLSATRH